MLFRVSDIASIVLGKHKLPSTRNAVHFPCAAWGFSREKGEMSIRSRRPSCRGIVAVPSESARFFFPVIPVRSGLPTICQSQHLSKTGGDFNTNGGLPQARGSEGERSNSWGPPGITSFSRQFSSCANLEKWSRISISCSGMTSDAPGRSEAGFGSRGSQREGFTACSGSDRSFGVFSLR